jgi:hypothetical protein
VPFVDLHLALDPLPHHGLSGDGVHPSVNQTDAGVRSCDFTPAGLSHGYNMRNLVSLEALARVKAVVLDGEGALDPAGPALQGDGTAAQPFEITTEDFSDARDTRTFGERNIGVYTGCSAPQDESGREVIYRYVTAEPVNVKASVVSATGADIDVHLLSAPSGANCLLRGDHSVSAALGPGTYYFALDTYVASGVEKSGEYVFVLTPE